MGLTDVGATVTVAALMARFLADPAVAAALFRTTSENELTTYYHYAYRSPDADPNVLDKLYDIAHPQLTTTERQKAQRARLLGTVRAHQRNSKSVLSVTRT